MINQTINTLLIEDNPNDARFIRQLVGKVSSVRFTWEIVRNLDAAQTILGTIPFDLVLLDLSLPDSHGLDTFVQLYQHAICLPIVILTERDDEQLAIPLVEAGAQNYLNKGRVDGEILVRILRYAIEQKRIEVALRLKIQQLESNVTQGFMPSLVTVTEEFDILLKNSSDQGHREQAALRTIQQELDRMRNILGDIVHPVSWEPRSTAAKNRQESLTDKFDPITYLGRNRVVAVDDATVYLFNALKAGSGAYAVPGSSLNKLMETLRLAMQSGMPIPPTLAPLELDHYLEQLEKSDVLPSAQLSRREREVVRLIAEGLTNREIAKRLSISLRTVERRRAVVMNRLGMKHRAELIAFAVRQGIVHNDDI